MTTTWTHRLARVLVKPLVGTGVRPNHLTTLRLISGLGACLAVGFGTRAGDLWGGVLWLLSAFLDRADGELARIGDMKSEGGHLYDYAADALINALVFAAAGVGARQSWLGAAAIPVGLLATGAMLTCWVAGEHYEKLEGSGRKAYAGKWGFDLDDGLYLLAPLIWLHLMSYVTLGAAMATAVMAVQILIRLQRLRARLRTAASV